MLKLSVTKRTDPRLLERMKVHYSQPKGFVGRNICFSITYDNEYYGHIVFGSATRFLPGRNEFFNCTINDINAIANNLFYNVSPVNPKYPVRNFTTFVLKEALLRCKEEWKSKYKSDLLGFETLVEKPRTGELYLKAGFTVVGETKGFTCKRIAGEGTDKWSGKRVWNTDIESLRPKTVLCLKA